MKRLDILDMSTLLQKVGSAPPVYRAPLDRQETILAVPGELEAGLPPMPPPIPLEEEAIFLESPPALTGDGQRTIEAPAEYRRQVAEMDARAARDARDEELASLRRRTLRLERILCAVMPSLLLIPALPEKRRKVLAEAIQLLRKTLQAESPPKAGAGGAPRMTKR